MTLSEALPFIRAHYGAGVASRLGPGERPALLIVDFARGWTDRSSPMAADLDREVNATAALLRAAHDAGLRAVFTTVAYEPGEWNAHLVCRKSPRVACMTVGSPWTEIDRRLPIGANDVVLVKKGASAFFGTTLAADLGNWRIDTLLVCGCVTSGCVRASAVDAAQYGIRPLVVREAVGDRSPLAHEANLIDIDQRYGDVITLDEAMTYIGGARRP